MPPFLGCTAGGAQIAIQVLNARRHHNGEDSECSGCSAGDGELARQLRRLANDTPHVHFPGWLDDAEISALLENADVGVCTTPLEVTNVLPNKTATYMAAGRPVLSGFRGDLQTILRETGSGFSHDPGNVSQLIQHLEQLATTCCCGE